MAFTPIIKLTGHNSSVYSLLDGGEQVFYSCGGDGYIVAWQKSGKDENGLLIAQCTEAVYCGCTILKNNVLVAGTMNGSLIWIDTALKQVLYASLAHTKAVHDIKQMGESILSCGADGKMVWHDSESLKPTLLLQVCNHSLRCMAIDETNDLIYVGSSDGHVYIVDGATQKIVARHALHSLSIFTLLLVDGILYSGSRDTKLNIWQAQSMKMLTSIDAHRSTINSLALLDDLILSGSKDKTIKLWDKSGKLIQSIYSVDGGHINSVNKVMSINGTDRFASASDDRAVILFGDGI